ncbi:50S ribosomal protein acetyltransferase [Rhodovulum sp. PH10]|uniref:GNAT family N-acetyltransferase n=1 Tax=Rhodovulum sp. PH10 TaxID=1187851 RepID=UPI00027C25FD|nr:GNAT family N-acetyltransferase [Rhodovulum sp. PH10]EJW13120.1 50S ribosomal protein acetyltransferase [Rhodovulum sp. PH10]
MTILERPHACPSETCTHVLETERLVLRAPRLQDAETVTALAGDRRIAENTLRIPHPYRLGDAEDWIASTNVEGRDETFLITLRDDDAVTGGAVIGACGLEWRNGRDPEVGYWLGAEHWGKGYATEALRALVDHAFADHEYDVLLAGARTSNPASRRVLEKCGFQWTGVVLHRIRAIASSAPVDCLRLERSVWVSLKQWGRASTRVRRVS